MKQNNKMFRGALRVASVISLIHAGMHQLGMSQTPAVPAEIAILESMGSYQMNVMGAARSYLDFYSGMGLFLTTTLVGFGLVLWQLSNIEPPTRSGIRPLLLTIALVFLAFSAVSIKFFFIAPVVMEALIAALVLIAYFRSRSEA